MTLPLQAVQAHESVQQNFDQIARSWPAAADPVGTVKTFAGSTAPAGYLLCDGSAVSRSTYATLFGVIGTTYGVGDGSTTFNVPDTRDRVIIGKSATYALGATGGAATVTLTSNEMPAHTHGPGAGTIFVMGGASGWSVTGTGAVNLQQAATTGSTGGGAAHANLQPYVAMNSIVKF